MMRLTVNLQWKVLIFTPKCEIQQFLLNFTMVCPVKSLHLFSFHLLAVRPAQASFRPYGLKDALLFFFCTLFLCISARKGWNAYWNQPVRADFSLNFLFCPTFSFAKNEMMVYTSPNVDHLHHNICCGAIRPSPAQIAAQIVLQNPSFHTKTTFWCENKGFPLRIYG